jgi:hypothetical protein
MQTDPELRFIFSNINEWLKFAEAKLAGIIVLNSAVIIGILSSIGSIHDYINRNAVIVGIIFVGLSLFWCIITQMPILSKALSSSSSQGAINLYFFGHLANLSQQEFLNELANIYPSYNPNALDKALINQILVNACITKSKFVAFKYAVYMTTFGIGIIAFTSIIKIVCHF